MNECFRVTDPYRTQGAYSYSLGRGLIHHREGLITRATQWALIHREGHRLHIPINITFYPPEDSEKTWLLLTSRYIEFNGLDWIELDWIFHLLV